MKKTAAKPQKTRAGGKSSPAKVSLSDRRLKALSYRKAGQTYDAIAANLAREFNLPKYSRTAAFQDVAAALHDLTHATRLEAESLRSLELERLDLAMRSIVLEVQQGDLQAIDRWIKISERRSKLLGLDAPIQLQVEERVEAELSAFLGQIELLLPPHVYRQVLEAVAHQKTFDRSAEQN